MLEQRYTYIGPVYKFGQYIETTIVRTTAVSQAKAVNNIRWKLARKHNSRYPVFNIIKSEVKLD